jgi:hypothetical protein
MVLSATIAPFLIEARLFITALKRKCSTDILWR